jgi:hypothetical protein
MKVTRHAALHEYNSNFMHDGGRSTLSEEVWWHWNTLDPKSRNTIYSRVATRLSYMYDLYGWDYSDLALLYG